MQKFRGFFGGKNRFVIKIPVLTPKTRFSRRKEYFTSEIVFKVESSLFAEENLQKFQVLFGGKDRFVIKIPVLTPKRGFLVEKSTLHLK